MMAHPAQYRVRINLAAKFTGLATLSILFVAIFFSWFLIRHERVLLTQQLQKRGVSLALGLARNCQLGALTEDAPILNGLIRGLSSEGDILYVEIITKDGRIIAHSGKEKIEEVRTDIQREPSTVGIKQLKKGAFRIEAPIKYVPEEITPLGNKAGGEETIGFVRLSMTLKNVNLEFVRMRQRIVLITIVIIAAAFSASLFISNRIARPLRFLVAVANRIAKGDLTQEVKPSTLDEVGELALAFNQMTMDLKQSRDKIEEHSRMLEERVHQRTKELETANLELRQMQAQLVQSAKMTAIGELGAGVAHELNNPLGGILGYAQYILEKVDRGNLAQEDIVALKRQLELILRESQRCKTIVENLLSFSRKSSELKPLDIKKVIEDTLSLTINQLALKNVKLVCKFDDLAQVQGNAGQLQQVFINIILNAQQAMPEGGVLTITMLKIKDKAGKLRASIAFKDTGCGIAKEHLSRVFEPFFTTKKDWKGTGLGLSVSYGIIHSHKGYISVESELGAGSTFTVTLPTLET